MILYIQPYIMISSHSLVGHIWLPPANLSFTVVIISLRMRRWPCTETIGDKPASWLLGKCNNCEHSNSFQTAPVGIIYWMDVTGARLSVCLCWRENPCWPLGITLLSLWRHHIWPFPSGMNGIWATVNSSLFEPLTPHAALCCAALWKYDIFDILSQNCRKVEIIH